MLRSRRSAGAAAACARDGSRSAAAAAALLRRLGPTPVRAVAASGSGRRWPTTARPATWSRALKFRGAARVADAMAAQIAANAPRPDAGGRALVPVPLHPRRLRRRGFNQAALLADALSPRAPGCALADCLERGRPGRHPGRPRPRASAVAGPAGSVELRAGAAPGRVLVDDVVTTGATLAACAAALRDGGATEVAAVAFARTLGPLSAGNPGDEESYHRSTATSQEGRCASR